MPVLRCTRHPGNGHCHPGVQSDPEGSFWQDPPQYWEQIVWPAYVKAHKDLIEGGELEHGQPSGKVKDLILVDGMDQSIGEVVDRVCEQLVKAVQSARSA